MQSPIGVDCVFQENGRVRVRRIARDGRWVSVEQGRQWRDPAGLHVLVMLSTQAHTLTLDAETLTWQLTPPRRNIA